MSICNFLQKNTHVTALILFMCVHIFQTGTWLFTRIPEFILIRDFSSIRITELIFILTLSFIYDYRLSKWIFYPADIFDIIEKEAAALELRATAPLFFCI